MKAWRKRAKQGEGTCISALAFLLSSRERVGKTTSKRQSRFEGAGIFEFAVLA